MKHLTIERAVESMSKEIDKTLEQSLAKAEELRNEIGRSTAKIEAYNLAIGGRNILIRLIQFFETKKKGGS